jgi:hypothetical protein
LEIEEINSFNQWERGMQTKKQILIGLCVLKSCNWKLELANANKEQEDCHRWALLLKKVTIILLKNPLKNNDYFATRHLPPQKSIDQLVTRYCPLKKVSIISLVVTVPSKKSNN